MDKHRADKLDDLFKEKLHDHEISPEEDYWPYVEKSLDKIAFYRFGWRHINIYNVSLAVLVVAIPALYFLLKSPEKNIPVDVPVKQSTETSAPREPETKDVNNLSEKKSVSSINEQTKQERKNKKIIEEENTTERSAHHDTVVAPASLPELNNIPVLPEPVKEVEKKPRPKKIIYVVQQDTIVEKDTVKVRRKRKN